MLISAERYFTIKHSFANGILITKARLIISSVVAWIATLILVIVPTVTRLTITVILILRQIVAISLIVAFQVVVYREVRRHEKQILALQVSLEERLKFQKEKRALKLTSIIIATVAVSYTTPWIITVIARLLFAKEIIDVLMEVREVGFLPLLLNSVIKSDNLHSKKKPFRIAVIELLTGKSFQDAKAFDGRLFGSKATGIVKTTRSEKTNEG